MVGLKGYRKRNRVNIKHVVGETNSITPGAIIMVKFNSKRYKASIIDLIDWMAPKSTAKRRRSPRQHHDKGFQLQAKESRRWCEEGHYAQSDEDVAVFS